MPAAFEMLPGIHNLGPYEELETLAEEFGYSERYRKKVDDLLKRGYHGWRRVRGDGNCFYRSFGFGLLEQIITADREKQKAWASSFLSQLESVKLEDELHQEAHCSLVSRVARLRDGFGWEDVSSGETSVTQKSLLYSSIADARTSILDLALIRALRALTSRFLLANADNEEILNGLSPNIVCLSQGYESIEDFCNKVVIPMGECAETVAINAMVFSTGVKLSIAMLETQQDLTDICFENVEPHSYSSLPNGIDPPRVHIQFRVAHYDLLYWRDQSCDTLSPNTVLRKRPPTFGLDGAVCMWQNTDDDLVFKGTCPASERPVPLFLQSDAEVEKARLRRILEASPRRLKDEPSETAGGCWIS